MTPQMPPLHIVNKSPFDSRALADCLARLTEDAVLLLIEDGVYAALPAQAERLPKLTELARQGRLFALTEDITARGLFGRPLLDGVRQVDYAGFVDLTVTHSPVQSWF